MNLQAEIHELRAMRAGAVADTNGEWNSPPQSAANGGTERRAAAAAAAVVPVLAVPMDTPGSNDTNADRDSSYGWPQQPAGEMDEDEEPTRIVRLITSDTAPTSSKAASASTYKQPPESNDAGLANGWVRVLHDSGLACYVEEKTGVVSWTKPYLLSDATSDKELLTMAAKHVPPLSIFRHQSRRIDHRQETNRRALVESRAKAQPDQNDGQLHTRKRKADVLNETCEDKPVFRILRGDHPVPLVEVNGVILGSPEGKSVNAFLRELAATTWRAVPQYFFSKTDDTDQPIACTVRINDISHTSVPKPSKPLAKEAAAETVLEHYIPGYWSELKAQGRVGKFQHQARAKQKEETKKANEEQGPKITLDEFKTLPIADPRIVQACMELSIKTPAQVVQEYQNRNRGISINYNTIPYEADSQKLFKTIVTAGSTAAEGIASTKKMAKQYAAQNLLTVLHQRTAKSYNEVADLYSSLHKGYQGEQDYTSLTVQTDRGATRASPLKKQRRSSPSHNNGEPTSYAQGGYDTNGAPRSNVWGSGYSAGYAGEQPGWPPRGEGSYGRKNERIVEYYGPPATGTYPEYYPSQPEWGYQQQPQQQLQQPAPYRDYRRPPYAPNPAETAVPYLHSRVPAPGPPRILYDPRPGAYSRQKIWAETQDPGLQMNPPH